MRKYMPWQSIAAHEAWSSAPTRAVRVEHLALTNARGGLEIRGFLRQSGCQNLALFFSLSKLLLKSVFRLKLVRRPGPVGLSLFSATSGDLGKA